MLFDLKGAEKEMRKFRKRGPGRATSMLIEEMINFGVKEKTLLDIGGGVGAIQWAFLKNHGSKTIDVDASEGYLNVASRYAIDSGHEQKCQFIHGDFVDRYGEIAIADYVTLDKVVCCYPDYRSLLDHAMEKCKEGIILVYPMGGFISKTIAQFSKLYFYIKRNPFRTYIHSPKEIERFICAKGFKQVSKKMSFPWHVQTFKRTS